MHMILLYNIKIVSQFFANNLQTYNMNINKINIIILTLEYLKCITKQS